MKKKKFHKWNIFQRQKVEKERHMDLSLEQYYPDASKEDYFKRENLFSELVNEFQRALDIGIGDAYSLGGNISGLINTIVAARFIYCSYK